MNKKLIIIIVVVLAGGGFAYKTFMAPKAKAAKLKVTGTIYGLPKQFVVNMADGRYATLTVALLLDPTQATGASADAATTTPNGFGTLPEEPVIRAIVTNELTNDNSSVLLTFSGRTKLIKDMLTQIHKQTDVKVTGLYLTDIAVQ